MKTDTPYASPAVRPGLRERNKLDKITRIRGAALRLFQDKGFDATTTRAIAEAADVGIGTVFMYADDKRDLLFLIFNDELDRVLDMAFAGIDRRRPFSAQVHQLFSCFYAAFHERPALARLLLKELVFFSEGKQAAQYMRNRNRLLEGIAQLARDAIGAGMLAAEEDARQVAKAFFFLYSGEVRLWLSNAQPDLAHGLQSLRETFVQLGRGLGESRGAGAKPGPAARPATGRRRRAAAG